MNKYFILLFFLVLAAPMPLPASSCGGRLIREISNDGVYQADIAVPPGAFTANWVAAFGRCAGLSKRSVFVQVNFHEDQPVGLEYTATPIPQRFGQWERIRGWERAKRIRRAQIHCIRGNCILRFADSRERVEVRVLTGVNPLVLNVEGRRSEVLDTCASANAGGFLAYVRTTAPLDEETGRKLYAVVSNLLPLPLRRLYVRNDIWFIENNFPQYYPFAPNEKVLTKEEFDRTTTIVCTTTDGAPTCGRWWGN